MRLAGVIEAYETKSNLFHKVSNYISCMNETIVGNYLAEFLVLSQKDWSGIG